MTSTAAPIDFGLAPAVVPAGILFAVGVVIAALFLPFYIAAMKRSGRAQPVREQGPPTHLDKGKVPTGAGVVFIVLALLTIALQAYFFRVKPYQREVQGVFLWCTGYAVLIGVIGTADDFMKVASKSTKGILARYKLAAQVILSATFAWVYWHLSSSALSQSETFAPYSRVPAWLLVVVAALIMPALVNGFNFTDGLDGLAGGCAVVSLVGLAGVVAPLGVLMVAPIGIIGALVVFLFFNIKPARVYMGDSGSYFLGALIAALCLATGMLWLFFLFGLVYGIELASVMIQVAYFRLTGGKRIFRMTPLHHHFEMAGAREERIVWAFWAVNGVATIAGVAAGIAVLSPWR
jgi:phospho-N-acetylmuramoyl-pentapeptide-transferase